MVVAIQVMVAAEPAGVFHKGEGVLTQEEVKALGGPQGFEDLKVYSSRLLGWWTGCRYSPCWYGCCESGLIRGGVVVIKPQWFNLL